jgi:hypothetical protein
VLNAAWAAEKLHGIPAARDLKKER